MARSRKKSRKKKNALAPLFRLIGVLVIVLCVWVSCGEQIRQKLFSEGGPADLGAWFEVGGDEVKLYLDGYPEQDVTGRSAAGEIYLPMHFVEEHLNRHFYWNPAESLLSYTLPDEVLDYAADAKIDGAPVFLTGSDDVYLSLKLIEQVTDVDDVSFLPETEPARVFVRTGGSTLRTVTLAKKQRLRTAADKQSRYLTELPKGSRVIVTDIMNEWSRVISENGFAGYISNRAYDENQLSVSELPHSYTQPEFPHVRLDEKLVLGWHQFTRFEDNERLSALIEPAAGVINAIAPQWLQIDDAAGNLIDYADRSYVVEAHERGLKVLPMVDNVGREGGIKEFRTGDFFSDTARRRAFIDTLLSHAETYGYDGFNLDFEGIASDAGSHYSQFFRELSVACHKKGLILSIDNYVPHSYNEHYNLQEQGEFADYVIIMAYDEHTGDDFGPTASLSFAEFGITEALDHVPAEGLILGVPFYTRVWKTNDGVLKSEAMGMAASEQYVSDNGIILSWDEAAGSYYGETMIGTGKIQLWLEENTSIEKKTDLIRSYGIGGLAAWRLGLEPADIWEELKINQE